MAYIPPSTIGQKHKLIPRAKQKLSGNSYGKAIGDDRTDIWTEAFGAALTAYCRNVNALVKAGKRDGPALSEDPIMFDWRVIDQMGFETSTSPAPLPAFRNIWFFSAPGSGADWWVGPSFEVGEWCKRVLGFNHQPVGFPKGGYLGLLGGDPGLSYNEVIELLYLSLKHLLDTNEYVQAALRRVRDGLDTDIEFWFSGYSQSADGMEDALVKLFGDGGPYAALRDRINGTLMFGNPSKRTTGIARKIRPDWLYAITHNITTTGDFYAEAKDSIRPLFYAEIVESETSLSFAGHIVSIAVPVIMNPLGGFGMLLSGNMLGVLGTVQRDVDAREDHSDVHDRLVNLLSVHGLLTNIPQLIQLLIALPGIQTHGGYHLIRPEFTSPTGIPRSGIMAADDIVAAYRRPIAA